MFSAIRSSSTQPGLADCAIFTRVRGLDEDIQGRTQTVSQQITMGTLDLYRGQQILGIDPDDALKGLYMIGGIPFC